MAGTNVVNCVGPSYHLDDVKAAIQSAVNCYPQKLDGDKWMMQSTPGEVEVAAFGVECRGSHVAGARWFQAVGNVLYEHLVSSAGAIVSSTNRGTLLTASGYVGMDDNQTQLAVVDGGNLYILNLGTNAFTQVTVAGWRGSDEVYELDGYFIFVVPGTEQFYISKIDDGTVLNALDFSSADSAPDMILTHLVSHRHLLLLGTFSGEFWINSGGASFPFVRYQSYTMDVGVVGKRAAIKAADTIFWIGQTERGIGIVYMLAGNQPQRVSTIAVEKVLRASTNLSGASMWTYQIEGHEFVAINAPGLVTTWVYDAAMQQWHERGEWSAGWQPLRSQLVTAFQGLHFAGDQYGSVVRLDSTVNSLASRVLVRERTWPHFVAPSMEPVSFRGLELAMKTGYGGVVTLEISNDAGNTFFAPLQRSLGAIGRWMQRVRWFGLGTAINRVFRIRQSDPVPFAIYSGTTDV